MGSPDRSTGVRDAGLPEGTALLERIVDLDDALALDPAVVGAKAAALAAARRAGLPVLGGLVVPSDVGRAVLVAARAGLGADATPHDGPLAVMDLGGALDLGPLQALVEQRWPRAVVRSSSPLEGDGRWAGALSSFLDVVPGEVPTAVAGCWASALRPQTVARAQALGIDPVDVAPAVLLQPFVAATAAGVAVQGDPEGPVTLTVVWGSPAPLLAGWSEGWSATIDTDEVPRGPAVDRAEPRVFPPELLVEVARVTRAAGSGAPVVVEWAAEGSALWLLQVRRAAEPGALPELPVEALGPSAPPSEGWAPRARPAATETGNPLLAWLLATLGGPLGDEVLLPWVLGLPPEAAAAAWRRFERGAAAGAASGGEARLAGPWLASLVERSRQLVVDAWQSHEAARAALAGLASGDLASIGGAGSVRAEEACAVLEGWGELAGALVRAGRLGTPGQLPLLREPEVALAVEGGGAIDWAGHRRRHWRWQPVLCRLIGDLGQAAPGEGVAGGRGAGVVCRVASGGDVGRVVPGAVVVVRRPAPQLAPALWVAAGLVAERGSGAAHLVEVARSLRVPAVVGVGPSPLPVEGGLALVDGDKGDVHWLGAPSVLGPPAPSGAGPAP
jgi:phosphohistidine swiveling domain-containing protein